ncbi:MAG TPA: LppX_LprAFG lipoprotein [Chloroflexia bacterium]|nr:LppX_LprAFG lipoprotein [Chloroflexia bacterium]
MALVLLFSACGAESAATPQSSTPTLPVTTAAANPTDAATLNTANSPAASSATSSSTADILNRASDTFNKLQTVYLNLDIRQGKLEINGLEVKQVEGYLQQPDRYQVQVKVGFFVGEFKVPVTGLNGEQYMRNEFGQWNLSKPEEKLNLAALLDRQTGMGAAMLKLRNPVLLGNETLQGTPVYHLQGVIAGTDIAQLTLNKLGTKDATMELWINQSNTQLVQASLKENAGSNPANWVFNFSKFNEAVTIQKPQS